MKVLLDTCVWGGALLEVQTAGHDVIWSGEWDEDPGDEEILPMRIRRNASWSRSTKTSVKWL